MMLKAGLTNNQLKVIALAAMTFDHIGKFLLPQHIALQMVGRIAFPIFAYMIAEGCRHTSSKMRYFMSLLAFAIVCQAVWGVTGGSLRQCVFVTFTLSLVLIFAAQKVIREGGLQSFLLFGAALLAAVFICEILPILLKQTDYSVDYGLLGVITPLAVFVMPNKPLRLAALGVCCVLLGLYYGDYQILCILSLPLLALYNGKRGTHNMKGFFYLYYPLHLAAIYLIAKI